MKNTNTSSTISVTVRTDTNGAINAQQFYDALMGQIDPELVTAAIPTLKTKYKTEKPADRAKREQRYRKAFARYRELLMQFSMGLKTHTRKSRAAALASAETRERQTEELELQKMEALFIQ